MRLQKYLYMLLMLICAGCRSSSETQLNEDARSEVVEHEVEPNRPSVVALQNLKTRVLVYCYETPEIPAQECAENFENKGYTRLKDIPRQPAGYDFLKTGTYPTRRWRNDEHAPRW